MAKNQKNDQDKKEEAAEEDATPVVDLGGIFKGLGLGGLINGLSSLVDKATELAEKGEELSKTGEFRVGGIPPGVRRGRDVRGVYGFTVRTMAGGKPKVQTFGNIKKTPKGPVVEEMREPIVDVFEEGDTIRAIAELPGIQEADIHVEVKGDMLTLSAEGKRKYQKEVLLPAVVDEENVTSSYENGILEIVLQKKGE